MSLHDIFPKGYVTARSRVEAFLKTCPGVFRGPTEAAVMKAARDAFGPSMPLNQFEAALRSCGFTADASRRSYDEEGKPGKFVVMLRLPEKPRSGQ